MHTYVYIIKHTHTHTHTHMNSCMHTFDASFCFLFNLQKHLRSFAFGEANGNLYLAGGFDLELAKSVSRVAFARSFYFNYLGGVFIFSYLIYFVVDR